MQNHEVELRKDAYRIPGLMPDEEIISEDREKNYEDRRNFEIDPFQIVASEHETANIPIIPRKILCLSIFLTITGFLLIMGGIIEYSKENDASRGVAFWIIGAFCSVPGIFYIGRIIQVWRAQSNEEKLEIIQDIPQWD